MSSSRVISQILSRVLPTSLPTILHGRQSLTCVEKPTDSHRIAHGTKDINRRHKDINNKEMNFF